MHRDGIEVAKGRMKFKCLKISHAGGCISCTCEKPCSNAKYGRTVHLVLKDNPRLFNTPPRSSKEKKKLQSPHQRLKLLLIISITPTIRPSPYNPCPSLIFCHQEDKSELRGATPHFLPRLTPKPAQEWLPANFTVHSDFSSTISAIRLLSPATSVIGRFLHRQSRVHYWLYLCHTSCHTDTP